MSDNFQSTNNSLMTTVHCFVSGKVQGVYYRQSTKEKAIQLNLQGWVRNLDDGRVELKASGDKQATDQLITWLYQGPRAAIVQDVVINHIAFEAFTNFDITT